MTGRSDIHIPRVFYPLAAMVFWGMSFVWSTILLKYYHPVAIIFIRLIISASFLFMMMWITGTFALIKRKDYGFFLLSAFFNPFLYFLCENYGLKFSSATIASIIIATIPVFSPVIAFVTYREKLTSLNIFGILVSFSGVVVMLIRKDLSFATDAAGVIFLAGAVISAVIYSVFLRRLTTSYQPVTIVAWQNLIGIFLFLPVLIISDRSSFMDVKLNTEIVSSFLLLAVLASSLSFVFFTKSVQLYGISKANIFSNLIPVFTAIFSWLIISEVITFQKIAGMVIVITGIFLSERSKKRSTSGTN